MHYILSNECRVQAGKMEEFLRDVQQWEEAAMASEQAPEYHAVYLRRSDPSIVLVLTHFRSKDHADAFAQTGLLDNFHQRVMTCLSDTSDSHGYDLYYGTGSAGPRVVFGEDART